MAALLVAAAVVALGLLYHHMALAAAGVPARTAQVRLQSGEDLTDLARRMVPHARPAVVVERIRELNHLSSADQAAGRLLDVPDGR